MRPISLDGERRTVDLALEHRDLVAQDDDLNGEVGVLAAESWIGSRTRAKARYEGTRGHSKMLAAFVKVQLSDHKSRGITSVRNQGAAVLQ